jgi:hypothetical protein
MKILHIDPNNTRQIKRFISLPFEIYATISQWVPPLENDVRKVFNRDKHPFYEHSKAAFFLAMNDHGQTIGRIAVLNNRKYNQYSNEKTAFFYYFECQNDPEASHALFQSAFEWAGSQGLNRMIGPKGFTVFDGLGLLIKGFEHLPAFGLPYNPPYYPDLIAREGFEPIRDLLSGYLDANFRMPQKILDLSDLVIKRRGLRITPFNTRAELRKFLPNIKKLYNDALSGVGDNPPLSDSEIQALADQLLWFSDPRLIKIVYKDDLPVGFLLAYPDISAALQRTKGKLLPFGWIDMLLELRRTKWININGAGIIEGYRGLGATAMLFTEMYRSVLESRYRFADLVQVGTENDKMQRELRDLGIDFYKTHRVYARTLG